MIRVGAELVGDVGAVRVGEAQRLGGLVDLGGALHALPQLGSRQQPAEHVERLDAQQDAGARFLDLVLLDREQQEDQIHHEVGLLQGLDGGLVAGQRVHADVVQAPRLAVGGKADLVAVCSQALRGGEEVAGVGALLSGLGQHRHRLALTNTAESQLGLEQVRSRCHVVTSPPRSPASRTAWRPAVASARCRC